MEDFALRAVTGSVRSSPVAVGAGMAVTGLPVTSVVLVVLLGDAATSQMPVVVLAVVVALVTEELLSHRRRPLVASGVAP